MADKAQAWLDFDTMLSTFTKETREHRMQEIAFGSRFDRFAAAVVMSEKARIGEDSAYKLAKRYAEMPYSLEVG